MQQDTSKIQFEKLEMNVVVVLLLFAIYNGSSSNSLVTSCTDRKDQTWNTVMIAEKIEAWINSGITVVSDGRIQSKLFHQHKKVFEEHFAYQNDDRVDDQENYFRPAEEFGYEDDSEEYMYSEYGELEDFDNELFNENDRSVITIGDFSYGIPRGTVWQWKSRRFEDGFLYGEVDGRGRFSGHNINYIYPDLRSGIRGTFINGYLIAGQEVEITGERCNNGIKELKIEIVEERKRIVWKRENLNATYIGKHPRVRDPLELRNTYIKKSSIPGSNEGVFARRDFLPGQLLMFFSGLKIHRRDIFSHSMTKEEEYEAGAYYFGFGITFSGFPKDLCIDQPTGYRTVEEYRTTLGHKMNHNFIRTNTDWGFVRHPSHGPVISILATKPIAKGEELFVNYNYDMKTAPQWYVNQAKEIVDAAKKLIPKL